MQANKLIRAVIDKPTEDLIKIRAVQADTTKARLTGYIIKDWLSKADQNTMDGVKDVLGKTAE